MTPEMKAKCEELALQLLGKPLDRESHVENHGFSMGFAAAVELMEQELEEMRWHCDSKDDALIDMEGERDLLQRQIAEMKSGCCDCTLFKSAMKSNKAIQAQADKLAEVLEQLCPCCGDDDIAKADVLTSYAKYKGGDDNNDR